MAKSYLLTPWSRALLEKLTGSQLVKKFPAFYGSRRFITSFTSARHLSLSWTRLMQSITQHTTSWMSILILHSHPCLGLPSGLFPSGFPTKTLHNLACPHTYYIPRPSNLRKKAQDEDKTSNKDCSKYSLVSSVSFSSWSLCLITYGSFSFLSC